MVKENWTQCSECKFPALYSEFKRCSVVLLNIATCSSQWPLVDSADRLCQTHTKRRGRGEGGGGRGGERGGEERREGGREGGRMEGGKEGGREGVREGGREIREHHL